AAPTGGDEREERGRDAGEERGGLADAGEEAARDQREKQRQQRDPPSGAGGAVPVRPKPAAPAEQGLLDDQPAGEKDEDRVLIGPVEDQRRDQRAEQPAERTTDR